MKKNKLIALIAVSTLSLGIVTSTASIFNTVVYAETLEGIGIDPTPLRNAVSAVDSARTDKIYTEESFNAFEAALVTGEYIEYIGSYYDFGVATLARNTYDPAFPGIGQTEFDTALEGINGALAQLVLKDTELPTEPPVDPSETYGQLQLANATATINEYYSLTQPSYTIESWLGLEAVSSDVEFLNGIIGKSADESIPEGETIANLQLQVDSSVNAINAAIAALELVPIVPPQVVSRSFAAAPAEVKVGETVNFTYTVTFDDGATQDGFSYYGIESTLLVKGGDQPVLTSPTLETINGTSWVPSEAGSYVVYLSFTPEGSDAAIVEYTTIKVSAPVPTPVDPVPTPVDPETKPKPTPPTDETDEDSGVVTVPDSGSNDGSSSKKVTDATTDKKVTDATTDKTVKATETKEAAATDEVVQQTAVFGDEASDGNAGIYAAIGSIVLAVSAFVIERKRRKV